MEETRHCDVKIIAIANHKCKYCDFATTNFRELEEHSKNHPGRYSYTCKVCNYGTDDEYNFNFKHWKEHVTDKSTVKYPAKSKYECPDCLMRFYDASGFRWHSLHTPCAVKRTKNRHSQLIYDEDGLDASSVKESRDAHQLQVQQGKS